jgi:hypothetical protein
MDKFRNRNYEDILQLSPSDLRTVQKRKGWALYFIGVLVYKTLILFGNAPKQYGNICPYFEIGNHWGGFSMGWFFVCSKDSSDSLKNHEVGHGVQNASIGGIIMLLLGLGSVFRYWKRSMFGAATPYDSWWYEGQATTIGSEYVQTHTAQ